MWIGVITLFPQMFVALDYGITGRAKEKGLVHIQYWNPRDATTNVHQTVDDRPYGGGPGMLMKYEPLRDTIRLAKQAAPKSCKVIYLSPQGRKLDQQAVDTLVTESALIFVTGRYEGIDERVILSEIDEEWSIGDYVLSGGELPSMVIIDSIVRLLPGALGDVNSAKEESFINGLLDYPHYTRPEEIDGMKVPEVLLSGNHAAIKRWRLQQALGRTWLRRPDLLQQRQWTTEEQKLLTEFKKLTIHDTCDE
ncbi:tRNA (guanosine(37)-N1)-methyltransferase TrmD [soil metagenome]